MNSPTPPSDAVARPPSAIPNGTQIEGNGIIPVPLRDFSEPVYDLLSGSLRKAKWTICRLVFSLRSQFFPDME